MRIKLLFTYNKEQAYVFRLVENKRESYNHKEAKFHIGEVADAIEYISTITPDMIGE